MVHRNKNGIYIFDDYPEFIPNLSPEEIFRLVEEIIDVLGEK